MWEPALEPRLPAGLWAAPGEGKAASSAPASSHLVNTINNVILAPCTSLSRARREFAELQLETGLERGKELQQQPQNTEWGSRAPKPHTQPQHPSLLWLPRGWRWRGQSWPPPLALPASTRTLWAPLTLIPRASCSEAQEKCMMDTGQHKKVNYIPPRLDNSGQLSAQSCGINPSRRRHGRVGTLPARW